ncbi:MAG: heat-inducible transcription repressor HrcA [Chloroflexi bacterium]|nr:MAG: heat-inducible transcription repressor HrcA [Chloroflexota bacterium]
MAKAQPAPRQQRILRAVVHEYIRTAQPVSSDTLVRRYRLGVSSATVRNDLAALEDLGLLTHPHTSAGRIPTQHGYRYFIGSLMGDSRLGQSEQMMVRHQFHQVHLDTAEWSRLAASVLARLSTGAALVTEPHQQRVRIRHLETVPVQGQRALLVVVFEGGVVRQQLLELPSPEVSTDLRSLSARLAEHASGKDAEALHGLAVMETGHARAILEAAGRLLDEQDDARALAVYVDGVMNLLRQPEFSTSEPLREVLTILEDRTQLARLLPAKLGEGEVSVAIGDELPLEELRDFSLVLGRYGSELRSSGFMGVVGPTRMDYARSIGAVRYVTTLMSELMRAVDA